MTLESGILFFFAILIFAVTIQGPEGWSCCLLRKAPLTKGARAQCFSCVGMVNEVTLFI